MSEEYGPTFVSVTDEDGNELELELLDTFDFRGQTYSAFLPAQAEDPESEDFGLILLKVVMENGEEVLSTPDSEEELEAVYEYYMEEIFDDSEDEG